MDIRKFEQYDEGTLWFAFSDEDSWRLCRIVAVNGDNFDVVTCKEDGTDDDEATPRTVPKDRLSALAEGCLEPVNDLLEMSYLHDSVLLHHIRTRYWNDVIYTNIGAIVLALNPYNYNLPLYTDDNMPKYIGEKANALNGGSKLPTHTWSVAHDAYWSMFTYNRAQSILVSGESGAGKTEAAKIVTKYLAQCSTYFAREDEKASSRMVTMRIERASPILEAFGNAKTLRNDNSSRFGKFMKLQFNSAGYLHGCYTINYLLEKSRVVSHAQGERSYHTYYQLLYGCSDEEKARFQLGQVSDFQWLFAGIPDANQPKESDAEEYRNVRKAFDLVGFSAQEQDGIYCVVAGIMHLQRLQFSPRREESYLDDENLKILRFIADLWKVDFDTLYKELITTTTTLRSETITKALTVNQATETRDALSKALYDRTFQMIIDKLNSMLDKEDSSPPEQWIGLLDIFGFENFEKNSFEQLCINFANEQLQNHYNTCVFARDMAEYESEGIETTSIDPPNNQPTLDLIGANMGVLALLTDQGRSGTDEKFLATVLDKHSRHKMLKKPRISNGTFGIDHYAGLVWYTAKGMREKNLDPIKDSLKLLMRCSDHPGIKDLIEPPVDERARGLQTVARFFQSSLQSLISMIDETNPHWIRCVKPHSAKKPRMFNGAEVMNQLRCAGVLETVKIRQTGYSMRIPHAVFWVRYKLLLPNADPGDVPSNEQLLKVLTHVQFSPADAQIGRSKVFLKDASYKRIEAMRNSKLDHLALAVQRYFLSKISYHVRHAKQLLQSVIKIQQFANGWYGHYVYRTKELEWHNKRYEASMLMQRNARAKLSGKIVFRHKVQHSITVMQSHFRAALSETVMRNKELEQYQRSSEAALLVQKFFRAKTSEYVYQERGRDALDLLEAELEVLKEIEEEKKRAEEARKQALRDKVRAQKGIAKTTPAAAAAGPSSEAGSLSGDVSDEDKSIASTAQSSNVEDNSTTIIMDAQKAQHLMEKEMELKKLQRQLDKLQQQVVRLEKDNKLKQKELSDAKTRATQAETAKKAAEQQLQAERSTRFQMQQALVSKMKDEEKAEELKAQMLEDASTDYNKMQQLAEVRRSDIKDAYKQLESLENEAILLTTNSILRQPFGTEIDDAVQKQLADLDSHIPPTPIPKQPFQSRAVIDMLHTALRNVTGYTSAYKVLKDFFQFMQDIDKTIPSNNYLPRETIVDPLHRPLSIAQEVARLINAKKFEDKNDIPLAGLDIPVAAPSLFSSASLDKYRKLHEPLLHKIQERQQQAVHKINKMELLQQDVVLLLSQIPDINDLQSTIKSSQVEFEEMSSVHEKEARKLKAKLEELISLQQEPLQHIEGKRKDKEVQLRALRDSIKKKRLEVQEEFNYLLQAEEAVAYILRESEFLSKCRKKMEQEVNRRVHGLQSRAAGMAAGAAVMMTEYHLLSDMTEIFSSSLDELKTTTSQSLGTAHEINYQLMQKHFAALEAYYTDVIALWMSLKDQLMAEEDKLNTAIASGGTPVKHTGLLKGLLSKETTAERHQSNVKKLREQLRMTFEVLMKIKERFRALSDWSHRNRVAEFLARYNKDRYGHLISTSAIPNALENFHWPDINEILEDKRQQQQEMPTSPL